ncbi:glycoside hydrolase superfamily [Tuber borchii]|uniref:beta-glucosidase n=1 Tax=Tuber borchii TaxID=42251 RepID=A0A2T7A812_TUBBO|nr:glycoside hydrolase superfamily [Tuber borchii]
MIAAIGVLALILGLVLGLPQANGGGINGSAEALEGATSPSWYPSPKGGTVDQWAESYRKAAALVRKMSLAEKVNITTGTGWPMGPCVGNTGTTNAGFPSLCLQDGPLGIRFADSITVFPAGITTAATWSRKLMYDRARALAKEAKGKGVNVLLGPCVGPLGRSPLAGRNWEGFGSDPYLQGIAGGLSVQGIQDEGVIATAKHFVANEQEKFRQLSESLSQGFKDVTSPLSSNIGDRALRELYIWPFMDTVRMGVGSVMCGYNQINNSIACQNSYILNGILKDELGFQGFVVSDWLAQRSGVASVLSGMDMTMPGDGLLWADGDSLLGPQLTRAVLNGSVPIDRLDDMALRIVATWYQLGQDDASYPRPNFSSWFRTSIGPTYAGVGPSAGHSLQNSYADVRDDHHEVARAIAAESITLLKNTNGALPLKSGKDAKKSIMIFGSDAGPNLLGPNGCPDRSCNNGTLGQGWGSGTAEYTYLVTPLEAIQAKALADRTMVEYVLDDYQYSAINSTAGKAPNATCLVFVSSDSGEGYASAEGVLGDRVDLKLWHGGDKLILSVAERCSNTIVVIHSVGPVDMEAWIEHKNVTAVLMAHLPGQESGTAVLDVLYGSVNPSGRLPYTIGKSLADYGPAAPILKQPGGPAPQQNFSEGLYIDYRHFDKQGITPRFEFGFGLSYTTFEFSDMVITQTLVPTEFPPARPIGVPAPELNSTIPPSSQLGFPLGMVRLPKYIYPYLSDTTVTKSSAPYPYPPGYSTTPHKPSPAGGAQGGHPALFDTIFHVTVSVFNTGSLPGKAVPQLYISYPNGTGIDFPVRSLRGFDKVAAGPGETVAVGFDITRRDLSYWDEKKGNWRIPLDKKGNIGAYEIFVGDSSRGNGVTGRTKVVKV